MRTLRHVGPVALTFIWCGLLIGISFLEAPLKFQAPNITTALGLGIGQIVFAALNKIEWVIAIFLILIFFAVKPQRKIWQWYVLPVLLLAFQSYYLLPILDARANEILAGNIPAPTYHHIAYIVTEIFKLASLLVSGVVYLKHIEYEERVE
jgi:hypothetical protein